MVVYVVEQYHKHTPKLTYFALSFNFLMTNLPTELGWSKSYHHDWTALNKVGYAA